MAPSGEHLQGPGSRPTPLAWSGNEVVLAAFDLDDVLVGSTSIVETAEGPYRLALTGLGRSHRVVVDATLSDPTVGGIGFESISGSSGLVGAKYKCPGFSKAEMSAFACPSMADPHEIVDLSAGRPEVVRDLTARMSEFSKKMMPSSDPGNTGELSGKDRERLQALGYLQ